jgi:hypothetical protein
MASDFFGVYVPGAGMNFMRYTMSSMKKGLLGSLVLSMGALRFFLSSLSSSLVKTGRRVYVPGPGFFLYSLVSMSKKFDLSFVIE